MSSPESAATRALAVPELVLEIVSYLDQVDLARTVGLSHKWRCASEVVLYRGPEIAPALAEAVANDVARAELLRQTLAARPDLARRVRKLDIVVTWWDTELREHQHEELATELVRLCREMEDLKLHGNQLYELTIMAAVSHHLPTLTCLSLRSSCYFDDIAPYLPSFPRLTHLSVDQCTTWYYNAAEFALPSFTLKSLTIGLSQDDPTVHSPLVDAFRWVTDSSRASLRHLTLDEVDADVVGDLLDWGNSLVTVHLALPWDQEDEQAQQAIQEALKLAGLHALRRLTINVGPRVPGWLEDEIEAGWWRENEHQGFDQFMSTSEQAVEEVHSKLGRAFVVIEVEED